MQVAELVSKIGQHKYEGSSVTAGVPYQNIPNLNIKGHRDQSDWRGKRICELVDVKGKRILDLGCSVGTISSTLKDQGASYILGVDHDCESIGIALQLYDIDFMVAKITQEFISEMGHFDVVVWTSQFMWMVQQHGMEYAVEFLFELSKKCDTLVFETAGKQDGSAPLDMSQEDILPMLIKNTCFQEIIDSGPWGDGWAPRNVFICKNPRISWDSNFFSKVERINRKVIRKTYQNSERGRELRDREIYFLTLFQSSPKHFQRLLSDDKEFIEMSYEGIPALWIPNDDLAQILTELACRQIIHRDIRPENLLWNGTHCVLIDFAYAVHAGDITNYHYDLGQPYKSPHGYNDEFSLRKTQFKLMEARCRN